MSFTIDTPADFFNEAAKNWDSRPHVQQLSQDVLSDLRKSLPWDETRWSTAVALDFGCGTGLLSLALASAVQQVHSLDASPGMIEQLRSKLSQAQPEVSSKIRVHDAVILSSENSQQLGDVRFDLIVMSMVAHHLPDLQQSCTVLSALLKPGGILAVYDLMLTDKSGYFHDAHAHKHAGVHHSGGFSADYIKDVMSKAGLNPIRASTGCYIRKEVSIPDNPAEQKQGDHHGHAHSHGDHHGHSHGDHHGHSHGDHHGHSHGEHHAHEDNVPSHRETVDFDILAAYGQRA